MSYLLLLVYFLNHLILVLQLGKQINSHWEAEEFTSAFKETIENPYLLVRHPHCWELILLSSDWSFMNWVLTTASRIILAKGKVFEKLRSLRWIMTNKGISEFHKRHMLYALKYNMVSLWPKIHDNEASYMKHECILIHLLPFQNFF